MIIPKPYAVKTRPVRATRIDAHHFINSLGMVFRVVRQPDNTCELFVREGKTDSLSWEYFADEESLSHATDRLQQQFNSPILPI